MFVSFSLVGMCAGMNTKQIIDTLQSLCLHVFCYVQKNLRLNAGFYRTVVFEKYARLDADHNGEAIFEYCPHSESQTVSSMHNHLRRDSPQIHGMLSPSFTIFHHLSPSFTIFHHLSPQIWVLYRDLTLCARFCQGQMFPRQTNLRMDRCACILGRFQSVSELHACQFLTDPASLLSSKM